MHWAFKPVHKPSIPNYKGNRYSLYEINFFVQSKLDQKKLNPSPSTENYIFILRVYLDLIG